MRAFDDGHRDDGQELSTNTNDLGDNQVVCTLILDFTVLHSLIKKNDKGFCHQTLYVMGFPRGNSLHALSQGNLGQ